MISMNRFITAACPHAGNRTGASHSFARGFGGFGGGGFRGGGFSGGGFSGGGFHAGGFEGGGYHADSFGGGGYHADSFSGGGYHADSFGGGGFHADSFGAGGVMADSFAAADIVPAVQRRRLPRGRLTAGSVNRGQLNSFLGLPTDGGFHAAAGAEGHVYQGPGGTTIAHGAAGVQGAAVGPNGAAAGGRYASGTAIRGPEGNVYTHETTAGRGIAAGPNGVAAGHYAAGGRPSTARRSPGMAMRPMARTPGRPPITIPRPWPAGTGSTATIFTRRAGARSIPGRGRPRATPPPIGPRLPGRRPIGLRWDRGWAMPTPNRTATITAIRSSTRTATSTTAASRPAPRNSITRRPRTSPPPPPVATPLPDAQWLPLGVFGLMANGKKTPDMVFQLAVDKNGTIRGNYFDQVTQNNLPVTGAVDKHSQRVAWKVATGQGLVVETGLDNLTQDESTALVHFGADRTEQDLLVRIKQPADGQDQRITVVPTRSLRQVWSLFATTFLTRTSHEF